LAPLLTLFLHLIVIAFLTGPAKILSCQIDSDLSHGFFIALMMEAVRTSETSVYSNKATPRYIPEGSMSSSYSLP
jgi:hypothetical protein